MLGAAALACRRGGDESNVRMDKDSGVSAAAKDVSGRAANDKDAGAAIAQLTRDAGR
jgi:hypothetical protein